MAPITSGKVVSFEAIHMRPHTDLAGLRLRISIVLKLDVIGVWTKR
jgi:hypothetical protein